MEHREYCTDCYREMELEYKRVTDFLKSAHNQQATLEMVSDGTDVSAKRIIEFIREGRIYMEDFPNLGYPCAHCGKLIQRQVLCNDCYQQLTHDINKTLNKENV